MVESTGVNFFTGFNLDEYEVPSDVLALVPREVALRFKLVPLCIVDKTLTITMVGPSNTDAIEDIKFLTGYKVEVANIPADKIERALDRYYRVGFVEAPHLASGFGKSFEEETPVDLSSFPVDSSDEEPDNREEERMGYSSSQEVPIVRLVNLILVDAVKRGASSIHIEPYSRNFRVRYRIEGQLFEVMRPPQKLKDAIVARIKIMADLDITDRFLPQKGRIQLVMGRDKNVDFNVSTMPVAHGESVVLHILDRSNGRKHLENLGFETAQLEQVTQAAKKSSGLILVTGPVGSGRYTTLYALLTELNDPNRNIFTIEDPILEDFGGINQVQLNTRIGFNLEAAIRHLESQGANVMMVGESPWDRETIEALIKSSLSGRLVLSSFQTENASSAVGRLLDMDFSPFILASSLSLICAQRLARRICKDCREDDDSPMEGLSSVGFTSTDLVTLKLKKGGGCRTCGNTGFKGFVGIQEVLPMSEEFKKALLRGLSPAELRQEAKSLGMMTLRQAGLAKVKQGLTTIAEILRVTPAD